MKKIIALLLISFPSIVFAQNVGIGTATPVRPLHITGTGELLRIQGNFPWVGFMNNTDPDYGGFLYYPDTSLVMGSRAGTNLPLILAPNNTGLLYATSAQRIGIGNPAPAEKLDVTGNINVTGTIKANGVDGTPNQVLMKNSGGNLAWGNLSEFKNFTTFSNGGLGTTWPVPTGVTKIAMEIWGGGGGGNNFAGGSGGGYAYGIINVTPGETITIDVGFGGAGSTNTDAGDGTESRVTRGLIYLRAFGGGGAETNFAGNGGGIYSTNAGSLLISHLGREGAPGSLTEEDFAESSAGTFVRKFKYGNGGDAGNAPGTGGKGGYRIINSVTLAPILSYMPAFTSAPGGGGAGGLSGRAGAKGLVIIHY